MKPHSSKYGASATEKQEPKLLEQVKQSARMGIRVDPEDNAARVEYLRRVLRDVYKDKKTELAREWGLADGSYIGQLLSARRGFSEPKFNELLRIHRVKAYAASNPPTNRGVALAVSDLESIVQPQVVTWEGLKMADLSQPLATQLPDDALAPDKPAGTWLEFDPDVREPGWPCLVKDADNNFYARLYEQGAGDRWQAVATRPGFAPLSSVEHGLTYIGGMVAVRYPKKRKTS